MTRLTSNWISDIPNNMSNYDKDLTSKIGCDLRELAFSAVGKEKWNRQLLFDSNKAAVIKINTGEGIIDGFDKAIAAIFEQIGIKTILCESENVSAINEAMDKGANIFIMADDDRYIAFNTENNKKAENDYCTALGFARALEIMTDGLLGKDIALLGHGRVGKIAAEILKEKGGNVWVYDKKYLEYQSSENLETTLPEGVNGLIKSKEELLNYKIFFDLTNEELWFDNQDQLRDAFIVAPGVPLTFDINKLHESITIVHDMLEIGTAVMLTQVL